MKTENTICDQAEHVTQIFSFKNVNISGSNFKTQCIQRVPNEKYHKGPLNKNLIEHSFVIPTIHNYRKPHDNDCNTICVGLGCIIKVANQEMLKRQILNNP